MFLSLSDFPHRVNWIGRPVTYHFICKVSFPPYIISGNIPSKKIIIEHSGQFWLKEEIRRAPVDLFLPPPPHPNLDHLSSKSPEFPGLYMFRSFLVPLFYFCASFSVYCQCFHSLYLPPKTKVQRNGVFLINMEKSRFLWSVWSMVYCLKQNGGE